MSKIALRTLRIFEIFEDARQPLNLTQVSKRLDIAPSSAHDILQVLVESGYLYEFETRGGFFPTTKMLDMCKVIAAHDPLMRRVEPAMRRFRDRHNESISLSRVHGLSATYVVVLPSSRDFRVEPIVGNSIRSLPATSAGKALLSTIPTDQLREVVRTLDMTPLTEKSITDPDVLVDEIIASKSERIFRNFEESVPGVCTFSTLTSWGETRYVLTVAMPLVRLADQQETICSELLALAEEIRA